LQLKPVPVVAVLGTAALVLIGIAADWWTAASFPSLLHYGGTGSGTIGSLFTSLLFGVGAIQLARDPDGAMSVTARQNRARRDARRRLVAARAGAPAPTTPLRVPAAVGVGPLAATVGGPNGDGRGAAPAVTGHRGLRLVDVVAGYGDVEVLHGVDLSAAPGRITAVFGPNGAGKSTTCLVAAGRVPLTSGAVLLGDEDVSHLAAWQRARKGLLLAPESRGVFPGLTVAENLEIWLPTAEARDEAYARFPVLGERRDAPAGALSGGEQQMLTLVPLLVHPPDLLIADEPTLGLAPLVVEEVLRVFQELRERGVALVLVEEKVRDVLQVADDVAFLGLGRITWHGPRAEVDDDLIHTAYLGQSTPVG
jgi:ABC-type branched-subunit amino acid transport system ATPase component